MISGKMSGALSLVSWAIRLSCRLEARLRTLWPWVGAVLDGCHPRAARAHSDGEHAGAIGQASSEELPWRAAGELPEVPVEVGLVVIAALVRYPRQARFVVALEEANGALETKDARERLGRQPDLLP